MKKQNSETLPCQQYQVRNVEPCLSDSENNACLFQGRKTPKLSDESYWVQNFCCSNDHTERINTGIHLAWVTVSLYIEFGLRQTLAEAVKEHFTFCEPVLWNIIVLLGTPRLWLCQPRKGCIEPAVDMGNYKALRSPWGFRPSSEMKFQLGVFASCSCYACVGWQFSAVNPVHDSWSFRLYIPKQVKV